MSTNYRNLFLVTSMAFLVSCASNSDVKDIKSMMEKERLEIAKIENRIDLLRLDIDKDKERLALLEKKGSGTSKESTTLKNKITHSTKLVTLLETQVVKLNEAVSQNSSDISNIKSSQDKQKEALRALLKENQEIKLKTSQKLKQIEKKYQDERARSKDKKEDQ